VLDICGASRFHPAMTERRTNLVFLAVFSVLAVLFVAAVLLVAAAVFFSGASTLPPRAAALPD
jgi:hypothetical protein